MHTSRDDETWDRDARYWYYRHGPLARVETGDLMVQGTDYAYTITAWLKGVNASGLNENKDIGRDGKSGVSHQLVARDAFGFILDYFKDDYLQINTGVAEFVADDGTSLTEYPGYGTGAGEQGLFNGNIHSMSTQFRRPTHTSGTHDISEALGKIYTYDQLNRLVVSEGILKSNIHTTGNYTWDVGAASTNQWATTYVYDPNGNIVNMERAGDLVTPTYNMDNLTYHYASDDNRLLYVDDAVSPSAYVNIDVDDQSTGNYDYDAIGNLIKDTQGGITSIEWTVYGKIKKVIKSSGDELTFAYDATGNRIMKKFDPTTGATIYTYYARDAQGNVMASYTREHGATDSIFLSEQHIYGSKRLGYVELRQTMTATVPTSGFFSRYLGNKRYELTNHLGNVMVVLTDRRFMFQNGTSGNVLYYEPDVLAAQDYDPFGMLLVGRNWEGGSGYRYGFNNMENDDEIAGNNNAVDFGARVFDARLGRWFSVDPFFKKFPFESPYIFCSSSPIVFLDDNGKDKTIIHEYVDTKTGNKYFKISKVVNNELLTESFTVQPNNPHSQDELNYAYYDFSVTYTHYMENGIEVSVAKGEKVKGEQRGFVTKLPSEEFMEAFVGRPEYVGVNFTSSNGQGQESKKGTIDTETVSIDNLLGFVATAGVAAGASPGNFFENLKVVLDAAQIAYIVIPEVDYNQEEPLFKCEYDSCGDTITEIEKGAHGGPFTEIKVIPQNEKK